MNTNQKGNYYKLRTKKWLEEKGYQVAFLERLQMVYTKDKTIPIKKDQLGSDLLAVNDSEVIFIQVKLNKGHISDGGKEFAKFIFPEFAKRWIVVWVPRAREPEIVECG